MLNYSSQRYSHIKIRIDESNYDPDNKEFSTTVDTFDDEMYENYIKGLTYLDMYDDEPLISFPSRNIVPFVRFKESVFLHKTIIKEVDIIHNRLFKSKVELDPSFLQTGFRKKLSKTYKNAQIKRNRVRIEHNFSSNDISKKRRISSSKKSFKLKKEFVVGDFDSHDDKILPKSNDASKIKINTSLTSSKNSSMKKVEKPLIEESNNPLNVSKEFKLPEDSIISNTNKSKIKQRSNRPDFVERLFENYDYNSFDPSNKIVNYDKNKNLCFSVIQDIYNKITY
jgi:hypothetical protein